MASDKIVNLTDSDFETYISQSPLPVLVDFWAPWCQPCRMVAPVLEELATALEGKLHIAKVNVDEHTAVATKYGIRNIPTFLLFQNGQKVDSKVGALGKPALLAFVQPYMG